MSDSNLTTESNLNSREIDALLRDLCSIFPAKRRRAKQNLTRCSRAVREKLIDVLFNDVKEIRTSYSRIAKSYFAVFGTSLFLCSSMYFENVVLILLALTWFLVFMTCYIILCVSTLLTTFQQQRRHILVDILVELGDSRVIGPLLERLGPIYFYIPGGSDSQTVSSLVRMLELVEPDGVPILDALQRSRLRAILKRLPHCANQPLALAVIRLAALIGDVSSLPHLARLAELPVENQNHAHIRAQAQTYLPVLAEKVKLNCEPQELLRSSGYGSTHELLRPAGTDSSTVTPSSELLRVLDQGDPPVLYKSNTEVAPQSNTANGMEP